MSKNTELGKVECLAYFPCGYKNSSETGETTPIPVEEAPKKKKKKRKTKQDADDADEKAQDESNIQQDGDAEQDIEDTAELDDDDDEENTIEENETENVAVDAKEKLE